MPNSLKPLSIEKFALAIKQRDPRLANVPDEMLVRKVLERRPDLMNFLERSEPRPPMADAKGRGAPDLNILLAKIKKAMNSVTAPGKPLDYRPGGPVDVFGRLWTPGMKGPQPSPQDDPFYRKAITQAVNPAPAAPVPPGISYAQELAKKFRDAQTLAATMGVKSQ